MSASIEQRNQDATCYVGNLDERVNEELLWELMVQCGPVVNIHIPKDKVSGKHQSYGFVEFRGEEDAEYALKIMNMIKLFGKPIKMNKAAQDKKQLEVGANIFIGNLDPEVDEKLLYDTFSAFGGILHTPKIMRDLDTGVSKGYGFISFDSFESSDMSIECMNGQYLCNRAIVVQYAFKKDTPGERHGSQAERLLASSQPSRFKPNTIFSGGNGDTTVQIGVSSSLMNMASMEQQQQQLMQMQMANYNQLMQMQMMYGQMQMPMGGGMQIPGIPGMAPAAAFMPPPPPPPSASASLFNINSQGPPPPPPQASSYGMPMPMPPPPPTPSQPPIPNSNGLMTMLPPPPPPPSM